VAIGLGEGGEFYRPMAVAIIGGTITSTLLTLLVVPTFYDSIEVSRDRAIAKYHAREARMLPILAFVLTFLEAILTLLGVRAAYRLARRGWARIAGRRGTLPPGAVAGTDD
jgi:HAE1 family hydrophobic/amphiphilic exporter-1